MSSPIVPGWWDGEPTAESKEPALGWWAVTHGYGEYSGEGFLESEAYAKTPAEAPMYGYGDLESEAYAIVPAAVPLVGQGDLTSSAYAIVPRNAPLSGEGDLVSNSWEKYFRNPNRTARLGYTLV